LHDHTTDNPYRDQSDDAPDNIPFREPAKPQAFGYRLSGDGIAFTMQDQQSGHDQRRENPCATYDKPEQDRFLPRHPAKIGNQDARQNVHQQRRRQKNRQRAGQS